MITEHRQELASLYALGALDAPEAHAFEEEMHADAGLRDLVIELQRTCDFMALASSWVEPPVALRGKVIARVAAMQSAEKPSIPTMPAALAALGGLRFEQAAESRGWKPLPIPGAAIKLLSLEKERGYAVLLGKLEAGARYPAHVNAGPEDFFILTGDLVIGERKLVAGDFHHADAGSQHEENHSVDGCTLLAVLTKDDPLVAFAMA